MKVELENFVERIDDFNDLPYSQQIKYFAYFNEVILDMGPFAATEINECFNQLSLRPYSNTSSYLSENSKGKQHSFIKSGAKYKLERKAKELIAASIGVTKKISLSDDLFPFTLLGNTRGYIENAGRQAIGCYDHGFYDACLVMIRKLLETLIIELFEKKRIESRIKNPQGQYFYLSDLIGIFLSETTWTASRNTQNGLSPIKKIADVSAHNRRFNAKKPDIDKIKTDLRIVIEELVHLIDFHHP